MKIPIKETASIMTIGEVYANKYPPPATTLTNDILKSIPILLPNNKINDPPNKISIIFNE